MGTRSILILSALAMLGATDEEILDDGWAVEDFKLGFVYLDQRGEGYQSQAGASNGSRGSEDITVISPTVYARIRQSDTVRHHVFFPVDLVTSASANALDAISSASAVTEAGNLDVMTEIDATEDLDVKLHYGLHVEELQTSFILGAGSALHLAEDNAVVAVDVFGILDLFDPLRPDGYDIGFANRRSLNANVSVSQILSPTTIAWLGYGLTFQAGTLETSYNSTPITGAEPGRDRAAEKLPGTRLRHAWSARIAQNIPLTGTTLRANYRYYLDDIGIHAHTADAQIYQYLTKTIVFQTSYRFHRQTAADFFVTSVPLAPPKSALRTSDSDLGAFDAHEVGARFMLLFSPGASEVFNFGYSRYWRPSLVIDSFELSYALRF